ncbi:MAG TPA: alpha/beta hydrolase [Methanocella sp.]|nr:alpha/beta hydrolase [Methanocella sp.]
MPKARINDINMYYEMHGQGEPIVLINGLSSDLKEIMPIIRRLSLKCRVLAFDNRGAGRTDKPDSPYSIVQMAGDTAALMDAAGMKQAHVVGISMGGRIAMALALQHVEKVKSLVLVSTFARQRSVRGRVARVRHLNIVDRIPLVRSIVSRYKQPAYAFERQFKASRGYDCSDRLGGIHTSTLILHGATDTLAPIGLAEEMHAGINGSQMITFQGGHLFFTDEPEKFCDLILDFLSAIH